MKMATTVVATTGPVLLDMWGVQVPALSLLMGILSVICVRIMFMAKDYRKDAMFWYYNISLTVLMCIITLAVIADHQVAPGMAAIIGTGIGASGVVLVDILKGKVESIFKSVGGHNGENS